MTAGEAPTIGILAGMGPYSTGPFLELVFRECEAQYGAKHDLDYPKILILSLPAPFYPDRPLQHDEMERVLVGGVRDLARASCGFIAIACNTAHIYHPQLTRAVEVPVLDMVELAASELAGRHRSVALVASRATADAGIYQAALARRGIECAEISWQGETDRLIGAMHRPRPEQVEQWHALEVLVAASGGEAMLLACADLTSLRADLPAKLPVVDATALLARGVVSMWLTSRKS
jgi:aspartate racemase